jgi:hypothetical protein
MRNFAAVFAVLALVALSGVMACDKHDAAAKTAKADSATQDGKEVVLTGYLTDSHCGGVHAGDKSCPVDCLKKGAKLQLHADAKVYTLEKVETPESHFGYQVKVTGILDESSGTVRVATIENLKKS